ncbi:hypothetical protein EK21DRAFT_111599 [Setomelanomma holmii]|uniref:Uncharacterized protein n=1 Tax=Setomelanomma holmii TaxID=210430 RepID=A0A9P4LNI6_9PLEO|nr:hypothetical protein EK21DRAFT_111599 [Setomelanomma holmii]
MGASADTPIFSTEPTNIFTEKAFVLVRLNSPTSTKPSVMTGFEIYEPLRFRSQSTADPSGTRWSRDLQGSILIDNHAIHFRPKAGISIGTPATKDDKIEVKYHIQDRQTMEKSAADKIGDFKVWKPDVASDDKRWSWIEGDGTNVWWEIAEVAIACRDDQAA